MTTPNLQVAVTLAAAVLRFRYTCMMIAVPLLVSCQNPVNTDQAGRECVYVKVTGSNMPVRQCSTREEREALAAQQEEAAQQGLRDLRALEEFGVASPGADSLD
jgi:hypothetical protein